MSEINVQKWSPMYWIARGAEALADAIEVIAANYKPPFECSEGMKPVPGGKFHMGSTKGNRDEQPVHEVTVSSFCMDKSEVTVEAFDAWGLGNRNRGKRLSRPNQPVVGVNWKEADAYCRAIGKRLPTEAEWEYAARGPSGQEYMKKYLINTDNAHYATGATADVCTHGTNGYGLCDMAGNAFEWCADWYGGYGAEAVTDPAGLIDGTHKVLRGGSWIYNDARFLRASFRHEDLPEYGDYDFGFRCVDDPIKSAK
jgi:formylglycine-generating enzyme required for sulfatase activity